MTDSTELAPIAEVKAKFPNGVWTSRARRRLERLVRRPSGFGTWEGSLTWAARVQGTAEPVPFSTPRALLFAGEYPEAWDAGFEGGLAEQMADVEAQTGPLGAAFADAGLPVELVEVAPSLGSGGPLLTPEEVEDALLVGRETADAAIDSGADVLLMAGLGLGAEMAAVAVCAGVLKNDIANYLPLSALPDGIVDDYSWMERVSALRDHLALNRGFERKPGEIVAHVAGAELGAMAAAIVTAASREVPVVLDGPVAAAAAMLARDFQLASPKWCCMPNRAPHPVVEKMANQAGLPDGVGLTLDLGDGAGLVPGWTQLQAALAVSREYDRVEKAREAELEALAENPEPFTV
ncbi:nicotinate-nucleotide--dimethylbenzimidazole phosphoribosyltransferase [Salininema proteolyticum]|uniref:Nicotinate-nucleotide--dimethylbenzimidazole phosphoribosyltransferase n=1 Tax=Salininema proteolyticum TaxID=1607685 RepID=A0ABV8U0I9_9ACTN